MADRSPLGPGDLWKTPGLKLPDFVREVAHALIRNGMSREHAIATAISTIKRWAAGEGKANTKTRARARAAVAEWEAAKAAARAKKNK